MFKEINTVGQAFITRPMDLPLHEDMPNVDHYLCRRMLSDKGVGHSLLRFRGHTKRWSPLLKRQYRGHLRGNQLETPSSRVPCWRKEGYFDLTLINSIQLASNRSLMTLFSKLLSTPCVPRKLKSRYKSVQSKDSWKQTRRSSKSTQRWIRNSCRWWVISLITTIRMEKQWRQQLFLAK